VQLKNQICAVEMLMSCVNMILISKCITNLGVWRELRGAAERLPLSFP